MAFELGLSKNVIVLAIFYIIFSFVLLQQEIIDIRSFWTMLMVAVAIWFGSRKPEIEKLLGQRARAYSLPEIPKEIEKIKELLLDMGIKGVELDTVVGEPEFGDPLPKTIHYIFSYDTKGKDSLPIKKKLKVSQSVTFRDSKGLGIHTILLDFKSVDLPGFSRSGARKFPSDIQKEQQIFQVQPMPIIVKTPKEEEETEKKEEDEKKDEDKEED